VTGNARLRNQALSDDVALEGACGLKTARIGGAHALDIALCHAQTIVKESDRFAYLEVGMDCIDSCGVTSSIRILLGTIVVHLFGIMDVSFI
jgi:hypothetical protein